MDSSVIITADGKPVFPPVFGTGGNEGRLDYSSTFMANLKLLVMDAGNAELSKKLLRNSILGEPVDGFSVSKMGQFDPGHSGGYNQGFGVEEKEFRANPWDFVLLMEGAVLWASSIGRRQGIGMRGFMRSPFTVRAKAVGYSSSVSGDEQRARAEIWAPLWDRPLGVTELKQFIAEGRADVGRHRMARNGIEFAEAATSLGVDRGIKEFARYSLLKRRGDSYVALPLGRFPVKARRESDLIKELEPMLDRLDWLSKEAPAEYTSARHQIDIALFEVLLRGGASRLAALMVAMGKMEKILSIRDHSKKPTIQPLNGLSPRWLLFADDGSVEFRIAAAIASIGPTGDVGPIRANLEPVDPMKSWRWSSHGEQNAWAGHSLSARFANILARRMMDAERLNCSRNPLQAALSLSPQDIGCFIDGKVDDGMIENLLFGMMWIRWSDRAKLRPVQEELRQRWFEQQSLEPVSRAWALLKLAFLPEDIRMDGVGSVHIVPEPAVIPTLRAGRIGDACRIAQRRLYSSGLSPIRSDFPNEEDGTRLAASLLLPARSHRMMTKLALVEQRK